MNAYREESARELVYDALASLSETYRQVLALYYLGGMSTREIAEFVGASPTAVRQRLTRARSQLKEGMIDMMKTTLEQQRLQAGFTFRMVEIVKRIRIPPIPRMQWTPWGVSALAGIVLTILSLTSPLFSFNPVHMSPAASVGEHERLSPQRSALNESLLPAHEQSGEMPVYMDVPVTLKMAREDGPPLIAGPSGTSSSVSNVTSDTPLGKYDYGVVVQGQGKDISGEIHISDINHAAGNFWSRGIPAYLEKFMNENTQLHVELIVQGGKDVYLSEDWPDDLFKQPILLMSRPKGDSRFRFASAERRNLREYLVAKEGFLFIDDDTGETGTFYRSAFSMLRMALPEYVIEPIPDDHEIYTCYYGMEGPPGSHEPGKKRLQGIFMPSGRSGRRLAVLISDRGYWDALIGEGVNSADVLRFCTNMVVYATTRGGIADYYAAVHLSEEVALFPDSKLGASIRNALGKPKGPVTEEELAGLNTLTATRHGIEDLTGIEHCINLQTLSLDGNRISDITPLSSLAKLQTLSLQGNAISDITPISSLAELQTLSLGGNAISDITPISSLAKLQTLSLHDNAISDITPLSSLAKLQTLNLYRNAISDITPLSELTDLQRLVLLENEIADISPLLSIKWIGDRHEADLRANPLNDEAYDIHIPALKDRGVRLLFTPKESPNTR